MYYKTLNKSISILITITFLLTNTNIGYAAPSSRSLFKDKKVDYDKINNERQDTFQKKQSVIKGEDAKELEPQKIQSQRILQAHLEGLSQIHIPSEYGRVTEVYQAPQDSKGLIVHIQDLHTNPEAELNLANILDLLKKDYNLGLVCSEGADGVVDTSSISSFPDAKIKEKVSRIFVNSGELTGEEYLSITKYPDLPIWGIEDRDTYFKNILGFNRIMKFNPQSQIFISRTKKALESLKPKILSKALLEIDQKEADYEAKKIETVDYLKYLLDSASLIRSHGRSKNIAGNHENQDSRSKNISSDILFERGSEGAESRTANYKNISLLMETIGMEKSIDQIKIMNESHNLLLNLQSTLTNKDSKLDLDTLMAQVALFKYQKISPFSFYSYLKDLSLKHIKKEEFASKYANLNNFIDYLTKVNSLDSTKLFIEMESLSYDIKERLFRNDEEKLLITCLRNIKFLESFFNLKISNEELDYYLNNKESHKVAFFKDFLPKALTKYNIQDTFIDYNPALIDSHLQELEDFYKVVKDRDVAMVKNSISEIEKRNSKVSTLIAGGFHTKGITKLLKENGYSYIVVSPYSKTDIDEENYHSLLQGKRKPITELLQKLDLSKIIDSLMNYPRTLRVSLGFNETIVSDLRNDKEGVATELAKALGVSKQDVMPESLIDRISIALVAAGPQYVDKWNNAVINQAEVRKNKDGEVIWKIVSSDEKEEYIFMSKDKNASRVVTKEEFDKLKTILFRWTQNSPVTLTMSPAAGIQIIAQGFSLKDGAFTQEVTLSHLLEIGIKGAIIGHSETRWRRIKEASGKIRIQHGDTDKDINEKLKAAHKAGLETIILCVGEALDKREADKHTEFILTQIKRALDGLTPEQVAKTIIAYEPIWAIGTGKTASPNDAQDMHLSIRQYLAGSYGKDIAEQVRILYGGSVNKDNAEDLLGKPDIDGALVGGASLKADSFSAIVKIGEKVGKAKSSRKITVAGNWKAVSADKRSSLADFREALIGRDTKNVDVIISPPATLLEKASEGSITGARVISDGLPAIPIGRAPSQYGPHLSQAGLRPLYEKIAWARENAPHWFRIKDIYVVEDQKHGMDPAEAITFCIVLENDDVIVHDAPVMGGVSKGEGEPGTHPTVKEAIEFFNKNVRKRLIGLNISRPDDVSKKIIELDEEFRSHAEDKDKPRFSYIGGELSVGISMISTIALAEMLHVPVEVLINYRYNEFCLKSGLTKELRPITIPVDFFVLWEGGKHGVAKSLPELVKEGIIKDTSRFPKRFMDEELIKSGDKSVLLAMVPPQELQAMVLTANWEQSRKIGIKLTKAYRRLLKDNGIKAKYGAESGSTTDQIRTADGRLITLELVWDILDQAIDSLPKDEARYVREALDIASSEMYIPEIDMYYIGPQAAGNDDGLVNNEEYTQYKLKLFQKHKRALSCEDWADENKIEHWESQRLIMDRMIGMGDDFDVSRPEKVRKYTKAGLQNAHLQKPNQSGDEGVAIDAVAISHSLGNVVVTSHRGTRQAQEKYTAWAALGMGTFGAKFTLWGPGRGALIVPFNIADVLYNRGPFKDVQVLYQGAMVLDPSGLYKDYGWAKRYREEIDARSADKGFMTGVQHIGMRQFIEKNDLRNIKYMAVGLEVLFKRYAKVGLSRFMAIQVAPKELKMGKTGFGGHYTLRRHARRGGRELYYIYIDGARLEGKTEYQKFLIVAEEVYEFLKAQYFAAKLIEAEVNTQTGKLEDELHFPEIQERDLKDDLKDKVEELAELMRWFDGMLGKDEKLAETIANTMVNWIARANSTEVKNTLQHFHDIAPKLEEEAKAIAPEIPSELESLEGLRRQLQEIINRYSGAEITAIKIKPNGEAEMVQKQGEPFIGVIGRDILDDAIIKSLFSDIGKRQLKDDWELEIDVSQIGHADRFSFVWKELLKASGWDRAERGATRATAMADSSLLTLGGKIKEGLERLQIIVDKLVDGKSVFLSVIRLASDDTNINDSELKDIFELLTLLLPLMEKSGISTFEEIVIRKGANVRDTITEALTIGSIHSGSPLGVFELAIIKDGILADGKTASLKDIVKALRVTVSTVRRDVAFLISAGVLIPVGEDSVKVASAINNNSKLKRLIYTELVREFSPGDISEGFKKSDIIRARILTIIGVQISESSALLAYQRERAGNALAMQYGRPLYELVTGKIRDRIGGVQGRRLFKALYDLGWIGSDLNDIDSFTQRVEKHSRIINSFRFDKDKIDIVGFDGAKVAEDINSFIEGTMQTLSDENKKAALIVTDDKTEEKLRQAPELRAFIEQEKVFIVRLRKDSPAAQQWAELLEDRMLYDFKNMTVQNIIDNKELIEALAAAK